MNLLALLIIRIGRRLPNPIKSQAKNLFFKYEDYKQKKREKYNSEYSLKKFKAICAADEFESGLVFCNNALAWGGAERQLVNTMRGLIGRINGNITLLCLRLGHDQDHDFYLGYLKSYDIEIRNIIKLNYANIYLREIPKHKKKEIQRIIDWLPSDVQCEIYCFIVEFLKIRPAIVHAWQDSLSISAAYAAKIVGVPKIVISHRNLAPINFAYYRTYMKRAYLELSDTPNIRFTNNSFAGACSYANWLNIPKSHISIIRNGINERDIRKPSNEESQKLRKQLNLPSDAIVLGSIYRFFPEKNPDLWLQIASEIASSDPRFYFVIFGSGPMKREFIAKAEKLGFGERLCCPGTIDNAALGLSIFNIFLLTSNFEGVPNVILEASLMGVPVITSAVGGAPEAVINGISGYVINSMSVDQYVAKIKEVVEDKNFIEKAKAMGPEFIRHEFNEDKMINATLNTYVSLY